MFVTASHCSGVRFRLDSYLMYQPGFRSAGNVIGHEIKDFIGCKVPCRQADASLFLYDPGIPVDQGRIAITTVSSGGLGVIDPAVQSVSVTRGLLNQQVAVGQLMTKVGIGSGLSSGSITRTCVSLGGMACQYVASMHSAGGDSGSPIFEYVTGQEAHLHGVLWGGPAGDLNTTYYSPLSGIEHDLGAIDVCAPPGPHPVGC